MWRRDFPMWLCGHRHESEAEALACAEEQLPPWLKEELEGYQPKPGEEFYADSMRYPSPLRPGQQQWFFGVIVSRSTSPDQYNEGRWECEHRHRYREDAVACAEKQLKDQRWHPK
jgi:hypothetical protein